MSWIEHSQKYVGHLRPGSAEHKAKIAEASRTWRAMKGEHGGESRENPSGGGGLLVAAIAIGAGLFLWNKNKTDKAKLALAAAAAANRPANPSYIGV